MQRRLVHKQFNSPINLYSQRNIQETLDRELKQLSNGAIGIDFDDPSTTKPPSLVKSAVLQALEDDERQQSRAGKGLKRVAWPPPAEFDGEYQHQQPVQQQQQQPYHYPPQQQPAHQQPLQQNYPQQQQQQHYQQPHTQPQQHQPRERIIPIQRLEPSNQQPQYQPQPTQAFQPLVSTQNQQQLYQHPEAVVPQQQQHQQFYNTTAADSQIPFVTTLRKEAPMSQEPTPVYHTEPVAAIYQGGTNMRGDQKWPPADVKKQSELENEERRKLAQQPAFRPRKVQKDYSDFFAKNALNATYPGYRAPPGTQHHS